MFPLKVEGVRADVLFVAIESREPTPALRLKGRKTRSILGYEGSPFHHDLRFFDLPGPLWDQFWYHLDARGPFVKLTDALEVLEFKRSARASDK